MSSTSPTLHLLCGKIAAGKSTLAARLSRAPRTVLISEDVWLAALFASEMKTPADYVRCSAKLRQAMEPHVVALLNAGCPVVLDFPFNRVSERTWARRILDQTNATHKLHVLNPPDEVCLARLHARNEGGKHPFAATEEQFHRFSRHFELPVPGEGFTLVFHHQDGQAGAASRTSEGSD